MASWIEAHTLRWPIFLSTTVALSIAAAVAYAHGHPGRVPWLWLAAWLIGLAAFYVTTHLDRQRADWPRMWGGTLLTLAVVVALPLGFVVAVLALWARRRAAHWALASSLAAMAGVMAMPLTGPISLWMFGLLQSWIMAGRR